MTNATKTLAIIFVVLLAVAGVQAWISNPGSSEAFRHKLVDVDTARVDRVEIAPPGGKAPIELHKGTAGWEVGRHGKGETYPADAGAVRNALALLDGLQVKSVVTRDTSKFTRYKVDRTGTRLTLYAGDQSLSTLYLGAPQVMGRSEFNSYVRPGDKQAVYTVDGFLGARFNRKLNDWRDKSVWDLNRSKIKRVDFLFPADSSYSLQSDGNGGWISDGDTLKTGEVQALLSQLSELRAESFADSLQKDQFGSERFAVHLQLENGMQKRIRLKPDGRNNKRYLAVTPDFPYVFTLNRRNWDDTVFKPRSGLLKH